MFLAQALSQPISKENSFQIVSWIDNDPKKFAQLMEYFFGDNKRWVQSASFSIMHCFDENPRLIEPYIPQMISLLEKPTITSAQKRNVVRIFQMVEIPKALQGKLYKLCYQLLGNPQEAIAVRAFSMTVLFNIAQNYPELMNELELLITEVLNEPTVSAGIKNRGKKTILKIKEIS